MKKNKALLEEYAGIQATLSQAVADCANGLNSIAGGMMCYADVEALPAEAFVGTEDNPMPWGSAVTEDRNCSESTGDGIVNFGKNTFNGAAGLIGYNTDTGWSWENAGNTWGGLGNLAGSLVIASNPVMAIGISQLPGGRQFVQDRYDVVGTTVTGLVGYDYMAMREGGDGWHAWKEDGVAAFTESALNVGTFFIPGAGQVGAGTKLAAAGSRASRVLNVTGHVADFVLPGGSWALKGGVKVADMGIDGASYLHGITHLDINPAAITSSNLDLQVDVRDAGQLPEPPAGMSNELFQNNPMGPHLDGNGPSPTDIPDLNPGSTTSISYDISGSGGASNPGGHFDGNSSGTPGHSSGTGSGTADFNTSNLTNNTGTGNTGIGTTGGATTHPSTNVGNTTGTSNTTGTGTNAGTGNTSTGGSSTQPTGGGHGTSHADGGNTNSHGENGRTETGNNSENSHNPETGNGAEPTGHNPETGNGPETNNGTETGNGPEQSGNNNSNNNTGADNSVGVPDGTHPTPNRPAPAEWTPESVRENVITGKEAKEQGHSYTPDDVQHALDTAPVDGHGNPVDHRTGEPLRLEDANGNRGWYMKYDVDAGHWVAENPGRGSAAPGDIPLHGEPGTYGFDGDGNRLPYANHRPAYASGQEMQVWQTEVLNAETKHPVTIPSETGGSVTIHYDPANPAAWEAAVRSPEATTTLDLLQVDGTTVPVTWTPGEPRNGLWDMGHTAGAKYSDLRDAYLKGDMPLSDFLDEYRNVDNYSPESPGRNRSHMDE